MRFLAGATNDNGLLKKMSIVAIVMDPSLLL